MTSPVENFEICAEMTIQNIAIDGKRVHIFAESFIGINGRPFP